MRAIEATRVRFSRPVAGVLYDGLATISRTQSEIGPPHVNVTATSLTWSVNTDGSLPHPRLAHCLQIDTVDAMFGPVAMAGYPGCLACCRRSG
jgi:hypothetical protein